MKFTSEQYPNLWVRDLGVRFVDGQADVDSKTAAWLRALPEHLGVVEVKTGNGKTAPSTKDQPAAKE